MLKYFTLSFIVLFFITADLSYCQDYIVGEGDVLDIKVYGHDDLATTVRVSGDGMITVPLVDKIKVTGLTISKTSEKIAALLADGYIVNPHVNVFVTEYRSQKAVILGQVNLPGLYELRGHTTLLELISKAGGLTKDAGDQAIIKRKASKKETDKNKDVIVIDMNQLVEKGDTTQNIPIIDGDSLFISKAGVFYVSGKVERPGSFRFEENLTVIKAITIAGGFSDEAAKKSVNIIRKTNGKKNVLENVKMDERIITDDVIVVPESFF